LSAGSSELNLWPCLHFSVLSDTHEWVPVPRNLQIENDGSRDPEIESDESRVLQIEDDETQKGKRQNIPEFTPLAVRKPKYQKHHPQRLE